MKKFVIHFLCLSIMGGLSMMPVFAQKKKTKVPSKAKVVKSSMVAVPKKDTAATKTLKPIVPTLFSGIKNFRTWSIGINAGAIAPVTAFGGRVDFDKWKPNIGYGFYVKKQITHLFGVQAEYVGGLLKGENNNNIPQKSFKTNVNWGASLNAIAILGSIDWDRAKTVIQPYVSVGVGVLGYKSEMTFTNGKTYKPKNGSTIENAYYPIGFGLKTSINNNVNLEFGYNAYYMDADDLDGWVANFSHDKFSYAHVGLEFVLGNKNKPQLARHNSPAQLVKEMKLADSTLRKQLSDSTARYNKELADAHAESLSLKADLEKIKSDSDHDGVSDYFDKCPRTPKGEKVDGAGCPLPTIKTSLTATEPHSNINNNTKQQEEQANITESDQQIIKDAVSNLEFEAGKATIKPSAYSSLDKVADLLSTKGYKLKLAGYTDDHGVAAANLKLSKLRTASIKKYLVSKGASASKIEAIGYGKANPIASNKTAAGRQKNRRVEFSIY